MLFDFIHIKGKSYSYCLDYHTLADNKSSPKYTTEQWSPATIYNRLLEINRQRLSLVQWGCNLSCLNCFTFFILRPFITGHTILCIFMYEGHTVTYNCFQFSHVNFVYKCLIWQSYPTFIKLKIGLVTYYRIHGKAFFVPFVSPGRKKMYSVS